MYAFVASTGEVSREVSRSTGEGARGRRPTSVKAPVSADVSRVSCRILLMNAWRCAFICNFRGSNLNRFLYTAYAGEAE